MKRRVSYNELKIGDVIEENIFRHDSLLALPMGTVIKKRELEYLKDLQVEELEISADPENREYTVREMLEIIEDVYLANTLWDARSGSRLYNGVRRRILSNKKIAQALYMLSLVDYMTFTASINISIIVGSIMMIRNSVDSHLTSMAYYSLVHDIGRIKVAEITNKEGKLTKVEFEEVRKHPTYSYRMLEEYKAPKNEIGFAMQTHEKYDGTGYPIGHSGEDIEPLAQIIAIAEMYDALSSFRPQRAAFHPIEVRSMIEKERNRAFGDDYVEVFMKKFSPYRVNTYVEMMDGRKGRIIETNELMPMFPIIEIYKGLTTEVEITVDLYKQQDLRIARVLI